MVDSPHRLAFIINIPHSPENASVFRGFFIAYAPFNHPKICKNVIIKSPKKGELNGKKCRRNAARAF